MKKNTSNVYKIKAFLIVFLSFIAILIRLLISNILFVLVVFIFIYFLFQNYIYLDWYGMDDLFVWYKNKDGDSKDLIKYLFDVLLFVFSIFTAMTIWKKQRIIELFIFNADNLEHICAKICIRINFIQNYAVKFLDYEMYYRHKNEDKMNECSSYLLYYRDRYHLEADGFFKDIEEFNRLKDVFFKYIKFTKYPNILHNISKNITTISIRSINYRSEGYNFQSFPIEKFILSHDINEINEFVNDCNESFMKIKESMSFLSDSFSRNLVGYTISELIFLLKFYKTVYRIVLDRMQGRTMDLENAKTLYEAIVREKVADIKQNESGSSERL